MIKDSNSVASATRGKIALTHRGVEALRPDTIAYRICDQRCPSLAIRVSPSGAKTWDLAYRVRRSGVYRRMSLGPFPAVGLDVARARAIALTNAAKAGQDLLGEEKAAKAAADERMTVAELVELYLRKKVRGHLRTAVYFEQRLKRTLASLNDRYVDEIRRKDLRAVLEATADRGAVREAQQQRQVVRVVFRWALSQDLIENDPSAGIASFGSSPRRDRVLSADEIKTFWDWISHSEMGEGYADALRFQLATGARIGEVAGIAAAEIDQENWVWTLPPDRSKNGRRRLTPIVGLARDILERRFRMCNGGPLFPAEHGGTLTATCVSSFMVKRRKEIPIEHFTSHDLRRTVATGLAELGFPLELVAVVLGHEVGNREVRTLVRHYVRTDLIDRKRHALETWSRRLGQFISGQTPPANVTPIRYAIA